MKMYLAHDARCVIDGPDGHVFGLLKVGHREVLVSFAALSPAGKRQGLFPKTNRRALVRRTDKRLRSNRK